MKNTKLRAFLKTCVVIAVALTLLFVLAQQLSIAVLQSMAVIRIERLEDYLMRNASSILSSVSVRKLKDEHPGEFLGSGSVPELFQEMSITEAQTLFHRKITSQPHKCGKIQRFGREGDGGYDMCLDDRLIPEKGNCLIYSFGLNMTDHLHKHQIHFHSVGIWGQNLRNDRGWQMKDLSTITKMLNHTDRVIDYLKIDVEGVEWPFIEHIIKSGVRSQIKQMALEIHTPRLKAKMEDMSVVDYGEVYHAYQELEAVGFEKFLHHTDNGCCGHFSTLTDKYISGTNNLCCYETFLINKRYL